MSKYENESIKIKSNEYLFKFFEIILKYNLKQLNYINYLSRQNQNFPFESIPDFINFRFIIADFLVVFLKASKFQLQISSKEDHAIHHDLVNSVHQLHIEFFNFYQVEYK